MQISTKQLTVKCL